MSSSSPLQELIDVNLMGSFTVTQEVVKGMKQQGEGGVVVFTSSQGGLVGLYGFTAYSAAKGAVVKLAEALHMEVRGGAAGLWYLVWLMEHFYDKNVNNNTDFNLLYLHYSLKLIWY